MCFLRSTRKTIPFISAKKALVSSHWNKIMRYTLYSRTNVGEYIYICVHIFFFPFSPIPFHHLWLQPTIPLCGYGRETRPCASSAQKVELARSEWCRRRWKSHHIRIEGNREDRCKKKEKKEKDAAERRRSLRKTIYVFAMESTSNTQYSDDSFPSRLPVDIS